LGRGTGGKVMVHSSQADIFHKVLIDGDGLSEEIPNKLEKLIHSMMVYIVDFTVHIPQHPPQQYLHLV
jgi:hypothetical protein